MRTIIPLEDRFWLKVFKTEEDGGCWLWMAACIAFGHGRIRIGGRGSRTELAHRVSWRIHFGEIPEGMCVLHRCNVPRCVNPEHLYLGTHDDNMRYMAECDRQLKGVDNGAAKLSEQEILAIRAMPGKLRDIAPVFGITFAHVGRIKRQENWAHV